METPEELKNEFENGMFVRLTTEDPRRCLVCNDTIFFLQKVDMHLPDIDHPITIEVTKCQKCQSYVMASQQMNVLLKRLREERAKIPKDA